MRIVVFMMMLALAGSGCDGLRMAPSETMKENAWLHERTAMRAAETAKLEGVSDGLCQLTRLSQLQSRAFVMDYGLPENYPQAKNLEDIINEDSLALAKRAQIDASRRIDPWEAADGLFEMGIGIAGLAGGVWGARLASFIAQAKNKTKALKEIVQGNEIFKGQNAEAVAAFKQAHKEQSPATRQLVSQIKNPATG